MELTHKHSKLKGNDIRHSLFTFKSLNNELEYSVELEKVLIAFFVM